MGLNDRLGSLERAGGVGKPKCEPIPREDVHALDVLADLKRDRLYDNSTPIAEFERLMVGRGVEEPVAHRFGEMLRKFDEEAETHRAP
jgi:hypothetical protein